MMKFWGALYFLCMLLASVALIIFMLMKIHKPLAIFHCAFITVYDVTDKASFDRLSYWHSEVKLYTDPLVPVLLVGNKTDVSV